MICVLVVQQLRIGLVYTSCGATFSCLTDTSTERTRSFELRACGLMRLIIHSMLACGAANTIMRCSCTRLRLLPHVR